MYTLIYTHTHKDRQAEKRERETALIHITPSLDKIIHQI